MPYQELIATYSPVGDLVTIISCACIMIMVTSSLYFSSDFSFYLFKVSLVLISVASLANLAFFWLCVQPVEHPLLLYLSRDVFHFCLLLDLYIFTIYAGKLVLPEFNHRNIYAVIVSIITSIGFVADAISPFTKYGFYRESNGLWHDSISAKPYTISYVIVLSILAFMLIFYKNKLIRPVQHSLLAVEVISLIVMHCQKLYKCNTFTTFTYLMPLFIVLTLVHSKPYNLKTGAMGNEAFESFITAAKKANKSVDYLVLKLKIASDIDLPHEIGKLLYNFWRTYFKKALLFNVDKGVYVLAIVESYKGRAEIEKNIKTLIENDFQKHYEEFRIDYKIQVLLGMDFVTDRIGFINLINYGFSKMKRNSSFYSDEVYIEKLLSLSLITNAIRDISEKKDLADPRVLVYCQPVKNVQKDEFDTAEALMRLEVPELGMVYPDIFIPIAERLGCIHDLSRIILDKTCKYIKESEENGYNIARISVNFSIDELRIDSFCDEVVKIISSNGIAFDKIAIELTESTNEEDFNLIRTRVKELKKYGISFYLDDFGTGYSNFDRILSLDIDIIKFDRSLLLMAEDNNNIKFIFTHFSQAFEDLDYQILFEGVENETQEQLCISCHADYLQGYKFSKPVPINQLSEFLSTEKAI